MELIIISDAPKFVAPQDTEGNAKVFGVADKELKLECSFKGNPAPNVTWEDALTSTVSYFFNDEDEFQFR